jgi:hypothetical protein
MSSVGLGSLAHSVEKMRTTEELFLPSLPELTVLSSATRLVSNSGPMVVVTLPDAVTCMDPHVMPPAVGVKVAVPSDIAL